MADAGWVAWTRYLGDKLTIPGWFVTLRCCGLQATGYKAGRFYVAGFWEVCYCKMNVWSWARGKPVPRPDLEN